MAVGSLDFSFFAMNDKLAVLIDADLAASFFRFRFCIAMDGSSAGAAFYNIPTALSVWYYVMRFSRHCYPPHFFIFRLGFCRNPCG